MRRKYRSQAGIVLDILEALASEGPINPTRLVYYANVPYDRLKAILHGMEVEGLISYNDEGRIVITDRGRKALEVLRETRRLLEGMGFRL